MKKIKLRKLLALRKAPVVVEEPKAEKPKKKSKKQGDK